MCHQLLKCFITKDFQMTQWRSELYPHLPQQTILCPSSLFFFSSWNSWGFFPSSPFVCVNVGRAHSGAKDWKQSLACARHLLCHWVLSPTLFLYILSKPLDYTSRPWTHPAVPTVLRSPCFKELWENHASSSLYPLALSISDVSCLSTESHCFLPWNLLTLW